MILDLASTAKSKLLKVVRGMIKQAELRPRPEDWENRIGEILSTFRIYPLTPPQATLQHLPSALIDLPSRKSVE